MKEETVNKIIEDINDALWHLRNDKCNVDTKEKGWDTYYGLDIELIDYIRKIEKENKELQQRIDKAIEYIKNNIAEEHYAIDFGLGTSRKWFNGNYLKIIEYLEGKDE